MERRKDGEEDPAPPEDLNVCSLEEKPHLELAVNINLLICLSAAAFMVGYWA